MKPIKEFEQWAEHIIEAAVDGESKKTVSRERNMMYQAQQKYPDYSSDQALGLYLDDKIGELNRRDYEQNKVINRQKQENEMLRSNLNSLGSELEQLDQNSRETSNEIQKLKTLSGQLRSETETQRIDKQELERVLQSAQELQNKPGISKEQYEQFSKEIEKLKQDIVNPKDFEDFKKQLDSLGQKSKVDSDEFTRLQSLLNKVETGSRELETGREDLVRRIVDLERQEREHQQRVDQELEAAKKSWRQDPEAQKFRKAVAARSKQASTKIKDLEKNKLPEIERVLQNLTQTAQNIENSLKLASDRMTDLEQSIPNLPVQRTLGFPSPKEPPKIRLPKTYAEKQAELEKEPKKPVDSKSLLTKWLANVRATVEREIIRQANSVNDSPQLDLIREEKVDDAAELDQTRKIEQVVFFWWIRDSQKGKLLRLYSEQDVRDSIFSLLWHHSKSGKKSENWDPVSDAVFFNEVLKDVQQKYPYEYEQSIWGDNLKEHKTLSAKHIKDIEQSFDSLLDERVLKWINK